MGRKRGGIVGLLISDSTPPLSGLKADSHRGGWQRGIGGGHVILGGLRDPNEDSGHPYPGPFTGP
jgi:hypothetical protein